MNLQEELVRRVAVRYLLAATLQKLKSARGAVAWRFSTRIGSSV
jgi:hypothetical protein